MTVEKIVKKAITAKQACKLMEKLGLCFGDDGRTFYATDEEWSEAYEEDWGYYTEWFDEYDDDEIDIICNELTQSWETEQEGANNE